MKWITKPWAGRWARRCPYCLHMTSHETEPGNNFVCQRCHAIVDPETYLLLQKCARELSKSFR